MCQQVELHLGILHIVTQMLTVRSVVMFQNGLEILENCGASGSSDCRRRIDNMSVSQANRIKCKLLSILDKTYKNLFVRIGHMLRRRGVFQAGQPRHPSQRGVTPESMLD